MLLDSYKAIGNTPELSGEEDVFSYAAYVFAIREIGFFEADDKGGDWLKERYDQLGYSEDLSKEKQWWVCVTLILEESFRYVGKTAGEVFCQRLLRSVEVEMVESLENQVNLLASAFNEVYPEFIIPRFVELRKHGSTYADHPVIGEVIAKIDDVYNYLASQVPYSSMSDRSLFVIEAEGEHLNHVTYIVDWLLRDVAFYAGSSHKADNSEQLRVGYVEGCVYALEEMTSLDEEKRTEISEELADILNFPHLSKLSAEFAMEEVS